MNDIFGILTIVLFSGTSLLAFFVAVVLLLPGPITETQKTLEGAGGRSLLLGLVNFIFFGLLAGVCVWAAEKVGGVLAGILILIAGLTLLALTAFSVIGLIAVADLLGKRIGSETTQFKNILRGGGVLILSGLTPYIGWFVFTPLVIWAGLGAAISTLVRKREKVSSAEETA